jgi:hypothetical protein
MQILMITAANFFGFLSKAKIGLVILCFSFILVKDKGKLKLLKISKTNV